MTWILTIALSMGGYHLASFNLPFFATEIDCRSGINAIGKAISIDIFPELRVIYSCEVKK